MLDAGPWIQDEKMNPLFLFIRHQESSIQHRFSSSKALFTHQLVGSRRSFARINIDRNQFIKELR
jgi:hypothetical protein